MKTHRKDLSIFSSCKCDLCIKEPIKVLLVVMKVGSLAAGVAVLSELDGISPLLLIKKPIERFSLVENMFSLYFLPGISKKFS